MRWWAFCLLVLAGLLAGTPQLSAQGAPQRTSKPFDMAPERSSEPAPQPLPVPLPLPPSAPAQASPPVRKVEPASPAAATAPSGTDNRASAQPAAAGTFDRPLLPYHQLVLEGEIDARAWMVVLTRDQAASPATLTLGYRTAVVVAPEASRLNLFINNHLILDAPIEASDHLGKLSATLPAGLLRAGPNLFRLQVVQRHRTDCTITSTYELRTQIDNAATALHFRSPTASRLTRIEDLAAVSADVDGSTHLRIIAPAPGQKMLAGPMLRFAQAASILIGMPNQSVSVAAKAGGPAGAGGVTAAIGTAQDLRAVMRAVPPDADSHPIVTFVDDPVLGPSTLVISGPSVAAVSHAVDAIAALVDRPKGVPRDVLDTSRWAAPNPPLLLEAARLKLSDLGVFTQEFSGRRFKTEFQIGIPSDFYANASGEATLLLDAAYSAAVLPGSHLDVYVNDDIAATTPLSTNGGEILRHLPIRIPMTHFRPGPNRITFEAQLHTAADAECLAGPTKGDDRFVLFDTSEFVMPDFARIARLPNLAALQGTAFPYNSSDLPAALVLGDDDPDILAAAATMLGRMAVAAGRIIAIDLNASPSSIKDRNAIFITTAAQIPPDVPEQLDLSNRLASDWKAPDEIDQPQPATGAATDVAGNALNQPSAAANDALSEPVDTIETFDRWRERLAAGGGSWRGDISAFQDWFQRTFQVSSATLRFLPSRDVAFSPPRNVTTVVAQGPSMRGDKAWTLLAAPTPRLLRQGIDALTDSPDWFELTGRVVSYSARTKAIQTLPVTTFSFTPTRPPSLANLRLIAANWLSENILAFSLLLFAACLLLGLATALFLSRIGRRSSA